MMHQYKIQHWGHAQKWFDGPTIWEMEPCLFSEWLTYINPNGGPMDGTRMLRTDQEATARFLGGRSVMDLRPYSVIEAVDRENEEFREFFRAKQEIDPNYCISKAIDEFYENRE